MKKIIFLSAMLVIGFTNAQVLTNNNVDAKVTNSNAFLDASTSFSRATNDNKIGKGIVFPDTDLTTFVFDLSMADGQTFPTYFDGMVVYNVTTGQTGTNTATQGQQVDVEPGFYYFYNPKGADNQNISEGKWLRIGGGNATNTGVQRVTGTFTHDGGNNAILEAVPTSATQIVSISIYRTSEAGKGLVGTSVYSYDIATKRAVFGMGEILCLSYPEGTYEYVVEYK